jgi:hypothetical protein
MAVGLSPSVLRDFVSTGHLGFQLVTETQDWIRIWNAPLPDFLEALGRRTAFAFGWTSLMDAAYRIRVHWMILWIGAGLYASRRLIARAPMHWWDVAVMLYIVCYFGPVILVADISSYGGRMVVVALPMLLYLAVRGLDDVLSGTSIDAERIVPARFPQAQSPTP